MHIPAVVQSLSSAPSEQSGMQSHKLSLGINVPSEHGTLSSADTRNIIQKKLCTVALVQLKYMYLYNNGNVMS